MKIVLSALNARFSHSSLALRYLRSQLRLILNGCGKETPRLILAEYSINELIDFILADIYRIRPDMACFSCYIWNIEHTLKLCSKLKKVLPQVFIVLGGPEVSYDAGALMLAHPYLDAVVIGEGEKTFGELVAVKAGLDEGQAIKDIQGITYREEGEVRTNQPRPLISDLDEVTSPYQGKGVREEDWNELRHRTVYFESSRGCPNQCQYCMSSLQPGVRFFTLPRVTADLEALVEAGTTQIKFVDRTFNCYPERAHQVWRFIIEQCRSKKKWQGVRFHFEIGADRLNQESLDILGTVPEGRFEFEIGVQSTNPLTLEAVKRRMDWDMLRDNVETLRRMGNIHLHLDLIAGLPHEPYPVFRRSFNDVYRLKPHRLQLGFLKMLKGSGLREEAEKYCYRFSDCPPYEVLSNDQVSFQEVLRLRAVEDLLEKYHNSGRFFYSLRLVELLTEDYMGLYEEMSEFWEEFDYHRSAHSNTTLYRIYSRFGERWMQKRSDNQEQADSLIEVFYELLKLDYLIQPGMPSLPEWFQRCYLENHKQRIHQMLHHEGIIDRFLPEYKGMSAREINKRVHIEAFKYNVVELAKLISGSVDCHDQVLRIQPAKTVVGFKPGDKGTEYFTLPFPE